MFIFKENHCKPNVSTVFDYCVKDEAFLGTTQLEDFLRKKEQHRGSSDN